MIQLINKITGTDMWVAEERAEEYLAAGHKPAADIAAENSVSEKVGKASKAKRASARK